MSWLAIASSGVLHYAKIFASLKTKNGISLTTGDLMRFHHKSALGPLHKWETQSSFMAKVNAVS